MKIVVRFVREGEKENGRSSSGGEKRRSERVVLAFRHRNPLAKSRQPSLFTPTKTSTLSLKKDGNSSPLLFFTLLHRGQAHAVGPEPGLLRVELEELGSGVGLVGCAFFFSGFLLALGFFSRRAAKRGRGGLFSEASALPDRLVAFARESADRNEAYGSSRRSSEAGGRGAQRAGHGKSSFFFSFNCRRRRRRRSLLENSFSLRRSLSRPRTCDLLSDLAPLGEHLSVLSMGLGGGHCGSSGFEERRKNENEAFRE